MNQMKIMMVPEEEGTTPSIIYNQSITKFGKLGKEVKISPKSQICHNDEGFSLKYNVPTVNVLIGIGKDHTAEMVMTREAWEALNNGEEISITTEKEFKEKFL